MAFVKLFLILRQFAYLDARYECDVQSSICAVADRHCVHLSGIGALPFTPLEGHFSARYQVSQAACDEYILFKIIWDLVSIVARTCIRVYVAKWKNVGMASCQASKSGDISE